MDKIITINLRLEQGGYTTEDAKRYRKLFEDEGRKTHSQGA